MDWYRERVVLRLARSEASEAAIVCGCVQVTETTTLAPVYYALEIRGELVDLPWTGLPFSRTVTKDDLLEECQSVAERKRDGEGEDGNGNVGHVVERWLVGEQDPPNWEELVPWLLSRLVVVIEEKSSNRDGSCVRLQLMSQSARGAVVEMVYCAQDSGIDTTLHGDEETDRDGWHDEEPPPYAQDTACVGTDASDEEEYDAQRGPFRSRGDSDECIGANQDSREGDTSRSHSSRIPKRQSHAYIDGRSQSYGSVVLNRSINEGIQSGINAIVGLDAAPSVRGISMHRRASTSTIATERSSQRRNSVGSSKEAPVSSHRWTEDRHRFELELKQSKKEIAAIKEQQTRIDSIAQQRREQVQAQTLHRLQAHEAQQKDLRFVKQSVSDTIELHEMRRRAAFQIQQAHIASRREEERLRRSMRLTTGRHEARQPGPVFGPRHFIQLQPQVSRQPRTSQTQPHGEQVFKNGMVYDLHGRRRSECSIDDVAMEHLLASVMNKIHRLLDRVPSNPVATFRQYDTKQNGTLDYDEFLGLVRCHGGGTAFTEEQERVCIRHFDPDQRGAIDYVELLWGFFDRRKFLKRWAQRKSNQSLKDVTKLFSQYDRRQCGAMSLQEFQLAMDNLGFRISDGEAKVLALRFAAIQDGWIDYNAFLAFVNTGKASRQQPHAKVPSGMSERRSTGILSKNDQRASLKSPPKGSTPRAGTHSRSTRVPLTTSVSSLDTTTCGDSGMDRILAELQALNANQRKIQALIYR